MATSTNLERPLMTEAQSNKMTATNESMNRLEAALTESYALDTSAATSPGDEVTIPFDDTNDLSDRTALHIVYLILSAGATADFDVIHPDNKHLFFVKNETTQSATVKTLAGTGPTVASEATILCYCDGTDVLSIPIGGSTVPTDYTVSYFGTPTDSQTIAKFLVSREITFPANFGASVGAVTTNPTGTVTLTVKDDGTSIGTIEISTGGVFTFATVSNTAKVVAAGSLLTVENQASADGTLVDVLLSLLGTIATA